MLATELTGRAVWIRHAVAAALTVALCLVTAGCAAERAQSSLSPEEMLAHAASTPVVATFEFDTTPGIPEGRFSGVGFMSGDDFAAELRIDDRPDVIATRKVGGKLYSRWDDEWVAQEAEPGLVGTGFVGPRAHLDFLALVIPTGDVDSEFVEDVHCWRIEFEYSMSALSHLLDGRSVEDYPEAEDPIGSGEVWIGAEDGRVRRMMLTFLNEGELVFSSEYAFRDFDREGIIEAPPDAVDAEDFEDR